MSSLILLRGGGDLASGVAFRLHRVGLRVIITELPRPMVVRRLVSFAEAVYRGEFTVEGVTARLATGEDDILNILAHGEIPVLVDPGAEIRSQVHPLVLVDARMTKRPPDLGIEAAELVIGLGPGFVAGENCHGAIETNRGHRLGRVLWNGSPQKDTGIPDSVLDRRAERVLRAPASGSLKAYAAIGDHLEEGQLVAEVDGHPVHSPFPGVLRGLVHPDLPIQRGMKIGDVDPRDNPRFCTLVSDKSLAIGGGVLEAILTVPQFRNRLWEG